MIEVDQHRSVWKVARKRCVVCRRRADWLLHADAPLEDLECAVCSGGGAATYALARSDHGIPE